METGCKSGREERDGEHRGFACMSRSRKRNTEKKQCGEREEDGWMSINEHRTEERESKAERDMQTGGGEREEGRRER